MRKRKLKIIIASVLIFLIITNPDLKVFKEHVGVQQTSVNVKRNYNFILFSIYQYQYRNENYTDNYIGKSYYLGIAANFFSLNDEPVNTESTKVPYNDY